MVEEEKMKTLGQFNTNPSFIRSIIEKGIIPEDKTITILEPSSGSGNFVAVLKEYGYENITAYEIDPKYECTGATIADFLTIDIDGKFDLIIGNPPFTSVKVKDSYYGDGTTEFCTRFIEMLFLERSLKLVKETGKIVFIFPNRLFLDIKFNHILRKIYTKGFYINRISILPTDIFDNTKSTSSVLVSISRKSSAIHVNGCKIPINDFLDDSNYYLYIHKKRFFDDGLCLGDIITKISPPEYGCYKKKITAGTIDKIEEKNKKYLAIVRVGDSSVGRFSLYEPEKYYFNDCFYFYKIKERQTTRVLSTLNSELYSEYIKLISERTGSRSIRNKDILRLKISGS